MSAHTSGPWLVATSNSWRRIVNQRGDTVCAPCNQPDGHPDLTFPNGGAEGPDANLIAAAPDLLEALRQIRVLAPPGTMMRVDAERAIAKAYGTRT